MSSKGGYCVGGFQEGSGNLKGLCGVVESSSLKKCRRLRDLLRFWNLRRIDVGVEGAERGINLRPRLRSFVSNFTKGMGGKVMDFVTRWGTKRYRKGFPKFISKFLFTCFLCVWPK